MCLPVPGDDFIHTHKINTGVLQETKTVASAETPARHILDYGHIHNHTAVCRTGYKVIPKALYKRAVRLAEFLYAGKIQVTVKPVEACVEPGMVTKVSTPKTKEAYVFKAPLILASALSGPATG
jgi:hypothetical protein